MVEKAADSESKRTSASNGSGSPSGEAGGSRRLSSYLQSVAQISGVVTVIAATVYALGMFTLVLPITNTYNSTFPAAWYAVSVVPKTVVVGHGIKSLVWPSLALTLATTLFALTMLWVLHISAIGWRHARAAAERPALSLFSILNIYTFLSVLTLTLVAAVSVALFGWKAWLSGKYTVSGIGSYVDDLLGLMYLLAAGLCVLSYSAAAFLVVARSLRGTSRLNRSRTFPSMSFRGFIYKGLAFSVLSSVFFFSAFMLIDISFYSTTSEEVSPGTLENYLLWGWLLSSALVVLFGLAVALFLMVRLLRYTRKAHLIQEARRSRTLSPIFTPLRDLSASLVQRASKVTPTVLYSMAVFTVLYLALLVAFHTLTLSSFLLGEVRGEIKSASWLDECFVPLVVFGALVSGVVLYWKDWKDLGSYEGDLLARGSWRHFFIGLLKSIGAHSLRRGLLLSLVVAYVIALASAFLLAELSPPPLPKVELNKLAQAEGGQPAQEPDFQGKSLALLAHTEGYWYLIDEKKGHLLVVPDQTDKFIRLKLDEQP